VCSSDLEALDPVASRIEIIKEDIRNVSDKAFEDIGTVIHLAGFSNDPTAEYSPIQNFSVNFDGTRILAERARAAGVERFIFGSTCSVYYTNNPDDTIRTESDLVYPKAPYSLSKHLAEQFLLMQKSSAFAPIIVRKGTVYGLSPRMRYDLAINTFLKNAFINKSLIVHAGGWMWRPFVDIQDVVRAYIFMLEAPIEKVSGEIFNLVGFNKPIRDIAEDIQRVIQTTFGVELVIKDEPTGPQRSYRVSGDKLRAVGFTPEADFSRAVVEIWNVLQSGAHDLGESKYYNIRQFEYIFPREF